MLPLRESIPHSSVVLPKFYNLDPENCFTIGEIHQKYNVSASTIYKLIRDSIKNGGILAKLGALLLMPTLKRLGKRLDVTEYGGAPLLGVNGCCIISHGSSNAKSICSAIGVANDYVRGDVLAHIQDTLAKEDILTHDGEKK